MNQPKKIDSASGDRGVRHFFVRYARSIETKGTCVKCGGKTLRSKYGILHRACAGCRYLMMIFGPNIEVTRKEKES